MISFGKVVAFKGATRFEFQAWRLGITVLRPKMLCRRNIRHIIRFYWYTGENYGE